MEAFSRSAHHTKIFYWKSSIFIQLALVALRDSRSDLDTGVSVDDCMHVSTVVRIGTIVDSCSALRQWWEST